MTAGTAPAALPTPRAAVQALAEEAVAVRRDLHRHVELSTEERRTQEVILRRLRDAGLEDARPSASTGATALVQGTLPGPNLLWRADIDGLPLTEDTGLPFASENPNAMHACGHDGHVAIGLALATLVQRSRERLRGTVRFAFQPAEERIGGARPMIDEGIMRDPPVERVFGLHIFANYRVGDVRVAPGPIFAAATGFRIIIRGRGGHASAPQETNDPIVAAAHVVVALQTVVSRSIDPSQTAVLTVGRIEGGVRGNIIPNDVLLVGSIRTFDERVLQRVLERIDQILVGVTAAFECSYQFDHSTLPAVVNDPECADLVRRVAGDFLGPERVREARVTGSDDMCFFLQEAPGAYFMLGGRRRDQEMNYPHHHPKFDFDEACLPLGIELGVRIIEEASGSSLAG